MDGVNRDAAIVLLHNCYNSVNRFHNETDIAPSIYHDAQTQTLQWTDIMVEWCKCKFKCGNVVAA